MKFYLNKCYFYRSINVLQCHDQHQRLFCKTRSKKTLTFTWHNHNLQPSVESDSKQTCNMVSLQYHCPLFSCGEGSPSPQLTSPRCIKWVAMASWCTLAKYFLEIVPNKWCAPLAWTVSLTCPQFISSTNSTKPHMYPFYQNTASPL